jgi:hypothetical protein
VHLGKRQRHAAGDQYASTGDGCVLAAAAGRAAGVAGCMTLAARAGAALAGGNTSGPFCPQPQSAAMATANGNNRIDRRMTKFPEDARSITIAASWPRHGARCRYDALTMRVLARSRGTRWTG